MVYCGKISGACLPCRTARRKCDQKRPACTQCVRRNADCLGYRDASAINIRDQSNAVALRQKERGKNARRTNLSKDATPAPISPPSRRLAEPSDLRIAAKPGSHLVLLRPIIPQLQDQAICYFQRNYVCLNSGNSDDTFYDFTDLYSPALTATAFHNAIMCVGMAGIAKLRGNTDLMVESHKRHSACLNTLNSALSNPLHAKNDNTLRVVMLMTLFEFITCTTSRSIKNWNYHVSGAVALLEHRGEEQLYSVTGRRMFGYLRQQIVPHCLQQKLSIPSTLIKMSEKMSTLRTPEETFEIPSDEFFYISARLCEINSQMTKGTLPPTEALTALYTLCRDAELFALTLSLDPSFQYVTKTMEFSHPWVYGHSYDIYTNLWIPHTWNTIRTTRIIALHTLHNLIPEIPLWPNTLPPLTILRSSAQSTIETLLREICATIPSFLGYPKTSSTSEFSREAEELPRAVCGQAIIWPLFVVGITQFTPMEMRVWTREQLVRIDREIGLRQALFMSKTLETKRGADVRDAGQGTLDREDERELWGGLLLVERNDDENRAVGVEDVFYG